VADRLIFSELEPNSADLALQLSIYSSTRTTSLVLASASFLSLARAGTAQTTAVNIIAVNMIIVFILIVFSNHLIC
jgi:hypothetical protein